MTKMYTAYLCHKCRELCDGFRDDFFMNFERKFDFQARRILRRILHEFCAIFFRPFRARHPSIFGPRKIHAPRDFLMNGLGTNKLMHRISFFTRPMLKCRSDPMNAMCSEQNGKRYDCAVCPDLLLTVIRTFFISDTLAIPH